MNPYYNSLKPITQVYNTMSNKDVDKKALGIIEKGRINHLNQVNNSLTDIAVGDFEGLITGICDILGYNHEIIRSKNRKHEYTQIRACLYWLLKEELHLNLCHIGRLFNRTHATIIHGLQYADDAIIHGQVRDKVVVLLKTKIMQIYRKWYEDQITDTKQLYKPIGR